MLVNGCTCDSTADTPKACRVHWPDFVLRNIEAGAAKANAVVDQLARDRETIATDTLNTFGELLLPHVPDDYRALIQQLWTRFAPVAVERVKVKAQSVAVIDERGPGSVVDLVDDRRPVPVVELEG